MRAMLFRRRLAPLVLGLALLLTSTARAEDRPADGARAIFALILGVNASPAPDVAPLRYADDDAARYLDLFRALGARAYVLSRLDANTRGLHPQAAAEASLPSRAELRRTVQALARDIQQSRARGVPSTLYLDLRGAWAGGRPDLVPDARGRPPERRPADLRSGRARRRRPEPRHHRRLPRLPAGAAARARRHAPAARRIRRAGGRLPGGPDRVPALQLDLGREPRVGRFRGGGVQPRGALGAVRRGRRRRRRTGDLRRDRRVRGPGQRGDRQRAIPPAGPGPTDPRRGSPPRSPCPPGARSAARRARQRRAPPAREPERHPAARLSTPTAAPRWCCCAPRARAPFTSGGWPTAWNGRSPASMASSSWRSCHSRRPRAQDRGAAHQAFSRIFSLAFDDSAVQAWARRNAEDRALIDAAKQSQELESRRTRWRRLGGIAALGVATAGTVAAISVARTAHALADGAPAGETHRDAVARNRRIDARNRGALGLAIGAGAAAAGSLMLFLWPSPVRACPRWTSRCPVPAARWGRAGASEALSQHPGDCVVQIPRLLSLRGTGGRDERKDEHRMAVG